MILKAAKTAPSGSITVKIQTDTNSSLSEISTPIAISSGFTGLGRASTSSRDIDLVVFKCMNDDFTPHSPLIPKVSIWGRKIFLCLRKSPHLDTSAALQGAPSSIWAVRWANAACLSMDKRIVAAIPAKFSVVERLSTPRRHQSRGTDFLLVTWYRQASPPEDREIYDWKCRKIHTIRQISSRNSIACTASTWKEMVGLSASSSILFEWAEYCRFHYWQPWWRSEWCLVESAPLACLHQQTCLANHFKTLTLQPEGWSLTAGCSMLIRWCVCQREPFSKATPLTTQLGPLSSWRKNLRRRLAKKLSCYLPAWSLKRRLPDCLNRRLDDFPDFVATSV